MKKWEYCATLLLPGDDMMDGLSDLGEVGWELVSVCAFAGQTMAAFAFFKRELAP